MAKAAPQPGLDFGAVPAHSLEAWNPEAWPIAPGWRPVIDRFLASPEGKSLGSFIARRLDEGAVVYPPQPFRALELTQPEDVRIVILGQDPYHGSGQAEGLAFSVAPGVKIPPSLRNIFKELQRDLGLPPATDGSLIRWAEQGVLLLNTGLTVEDGAPMSHAKKGWEVLTDALIAEVAAKASPCVYMLWGAPAQAKAALIESTAALHGREALILKSNHPSPLSALRPPVPFLGNAHFSRAQAWLAERGQELTMFRSG